MTQSIALGPAPVGLTVRLVRDASWWSILRAADAYPDGTRVELRFDTDDVWAATVSGTDATWDVVPATVDALIAAGPKKVGLWYVTADGHEIPWGSGRVNVSG